MLSACPLPSTLTVRRGSSWGMVRRLGSWSVGKGLVVRGEGRASEVWDAIGRWARIGFPVISGAGSGAVWYDKTR